MRFQHYYNTYVLAEMVYLVEANNVLDYTDILVNQHLPERSKTTQKECF